MLNYATQDPAVLIGSKTSLNVATGETLTDYYNFDGTTSKAIETGEASKIEFNCIYTAGTGETTNSVEIIVEASSDRSNWYQLLNETVASGVSTLDDREFTHVQSVTYGTVGYDAETTGFTAGLLVTGNGGATGIIESDTELVADTSGTLLLSNITGTFVNDEALTDSGTGAAAVNGVLTSITRFSLPVDISNKYTRVSAKETGKATNFGTIFVEAIVNTR